MAEHLVAHVEERLGRNLHVPVARNGVERDAQNGNEEQQDRHPDEKTEVTREESVVDEDLQEIGLCEAEERPEHRDGEYESELLQ